MYKQSHWLSIISCFGCQMILVNDSFLMQSLQTIDESCEKSDQLIHSQHWVHGCSVDHWSGSRNSALWCAAEVVTRTNALWVLNSMKITPELTDLCWRKKEQQIEKHSTQTYNKWHIWRFFNRNSVFHEVVLNGEILNGLHNWVVILYLQYPLEAWCCRRLRQKTIPCFLYHFSIT